MDSHWTIEEGVPLPLGATWDGKGTNFALFSAHATKVTLCLFDDNGEKEVARLDLPEYTNEIWHGYVPGLRPGALYGYRVEGPYEPDAGHRFNAHKLLLDPYARAFHGFYQGHPACYGYKLGHPDKDLSFDDQDSAPYVPKSVVIDSQFSWISNNYHRVPWDQTIFYEAHVKGMTKSHPGVPPDLQGTYAGLSVPAVMNYIKSLGITSLELMPVHAFLDGDHLLHKGLQNYWGYNSIGFFAPDIRYAAQPQRVIQEFKQMVSCYHENDIEIILDVVYNHTAEENECGPTLCFKGIDNVSYYRLLPDQKRYYINDTGTGNTLNISHPRVIQMVMDSLRYWASEMRVDGFRFDLATIMAREENGFDNQSAFLKACCQDPVLAPCKFIAEPWDCGPGGYQIGQFMPAWGEWNGEYRDNVRDFWRGVGSLSDMAECLVGSPRLFNRNGRNPSSSINFITAHDGLTLRDLVSYNDKHNEQNGEDNQDGINDNHSWNCGAEGETDDREIMQLRQRQVLNFLATLFVSQGTPMLLAGDESSQTKQGNNNTYCQDNEISWINWELETPAQQLQDHVRHLIALRQKYPILRNRHFLSSSQISWYGPGGVPMGDESWEGGDIPHFLCLKLDDPGAEGREAVRLWLIMNAHHEAVFFSVGSEGAWDIEFDSAAPERTGQRLEAHDFEMPPRSMLILAGR